MTETFEVYVGNLQSNTEKKQLKELFSQIGHVQYIWINAKYQPLTYAFVGFDSLKTANSACKFLNDVKINGQIIKVKPSLKRLDHQKSVLLDLPKITTCSKNQKLMTILHRNLRQNKDIAQDFKTACQEMDYLTDTDQGEIVRTEAEPCTLKTLEETVIRNFKKPRQKKQIPIDFDLTKGQKLTNEQYDKWFKMKLPMTEQQKQETKTETVVKRKIPCVMDYRCVCDSD